ncbi:MAG: 23S rRNA (pseudouridine(1915)-N(3))-methyltransferase RlmH [Candidatus Aminicenantes bacterium]|nr:23S rRNA (pseudouridine(1915)-N(3))-methyltransferase RlmH [Candidatus Aminicenantes bacterium]
MKLRLLWPGRTRSPEFRRLEEAYLERINRMAPCRLIVTREARGFDEGRPDRILDFEAEGLEKHLKDDYIICLIDRGRDMSSTEFARFLRQRETASGQPLAFVAGGFLGLAERVLARADLKLSLSRMTFSHELSRIVLLEQVYRSLTILRGRSYAK